MDFIERAKEKEYYDDLMWVKPISSSVVVEEETTWFPGFTRRVSVERRSSFVTRTTALGHHKF